MDGVTIIQTMPQYQFTWGWDWGIVALFVIFALGVFLIYTGIDGNVGALVPCGVMLCLIAVIGTIAMSSQAKQIFTHNQYQVIVDDSVSMAEFMDRYNVIERQGTSYIVEER